MTYDFTRLSHGDFEELVQDLLSAEYGIQLQGFTTGRDRGIDLRCARDPSKAWIVQCKHYARSTFAKLLHELRTKEAPKVEKLKPARYVVATSVALTPGNVDDVFELFHPYCRTPDDVIGSNNIEALLRKYPAVLKRHFKLGLASSEVLERLLHNDVYTQSENELASMRDKARLMVQIAALAKADEILATKRVLVVCGPPGIGKTTTAQILLLRHIERGWTVVSISRSVRESNLVFNAETKQIFYYDDFLGDIDLSQNEDRDLLRVCDRIS